MHEQMAAWTSKVLNFLKQMLTGLLVTAVLWYVYKFTVKRFKSLTGKAVEDVPLVFAADDVVQFVPKAGTVIDIKSDRTADAILSGTFGPAVVMVYADWCVHCKNMMQAYELAATQAGVPFVRLQGHHMPVTAKKRAVMGYPTVFGVAHDGQLSQFAKERVVSHLMEFAAGLRPVEPPVQPLVEHTVQPVQMEPTIIEEDVIMIG